jgi:hypothetical protein
VCRSAFARHTGSSNSLLQQQQAGSSGKKKKQKTALGASEVVAAAAGSELLELLLLPGGKGLLAATGDARLLFFHPKVGGEFGVGGFAEARGLNVSIGTGPALLFAVV